MKDDLDVLSTCDICHAPTPLSELNLTVVYKEEPSGTYDEDGREIFVTIQQIVSTCPRCS